MLLDSNILIYAAEPASAFLSKWVEDPGACISTVSRIEVLGFRGWSLLDSGRRASLELLVNTLPELSLNSAIVDCAIELRRQRKMSLADAIIAATALVYGLPVITRNTEDFAQVPGLRVMNPFLGSGES